MQKHALKRRSVSHLNIRPLGKLNEELISDQAVQIPIQCITVVSTRNLRLIYVSRFFGVLLLCSPTQVIFQGTCRPQ